MLTWRKLFADLGSSWHVWKWVGSRSCIREANTKKENWWLAHPFWDCYPFLCTQLRNTPSDGSFKYVRKFVFMIFCIVCSSLLRTLWDFHYLPWYSAHNATQSHRQPIAIQRKNSVFNKTTNLWNSPTSPNRLCSFTLRPILRIPLINRQIMFPLTHRLLNTLPLFHSLHPRPPPPPHLFILPSFSFVRHPQPALEVIKHPQPIRPRRKHNVNKAKLLAEEIRSFGVHFPRKLLEMIEELGLLLLQPVLSLVLQKAVIRRDDPAPHVIRPDARSRAVIGVTWLQVRRVVGERVLEELA